MTCQSCDKPLHGIAPSVSPNGGQNITIPLCPDCLEKASRLIRKEEHTYQLVYVITRTEIYDSLPTTNTFLYYEEKDAINAFTTLYKEDTNKICPIGENRYYANKHNTDIYGKLETLYIRY